MTIENNVFYERDRAIGTHKYTDEVYHDQIIIRNNKIEKMCQDAIRVLNWSNATIENNTFKDVDPGENNANRGIFASGAINPTFQNNLFENIPRPMQFTAWENDAFGSQYDVTYNGLSKDNKEALSTNTVINYVEDFIRINPKHKKYDKEHTELIPVKTAQPPVLPKPDSGYSETLNFMKQNTQRECPENTFSFYENLFHAKILMLLYPNHWNTNYWEICPNMKGL